MLLMRLVTFGFNTANDPGLNLLAISIVTSSLVIFKGVFVHQIYKQCSLDVLEMTCYLNTAIIGFASLYATNKPEKEQKVIAYISGTIAFLLFLLIVAYHIFKEICLKVWKKLSIKGEVNLIMPVDGDQRDVNC